MFNSKLTAIPVFEYCPVTLVTYGICRPILLQFTLKMYSRTVLATVWFAVLCTRFV